MEGTKTYSNNGEKINYASTFMDVAKSSGVSAYHIASRIKQEQGQKGTSLLFRVHIPDMKDIIIILILVQPETRRIRFIKMVCLLPRSRDGIQE